MLGRERGAEMQRWTRPFSTRRVRGRGRACMAWRGARTRLFSPLPRVLVPDFLVTSSVTNLDTYYPDLNIYKGDKKFYHQKNFVIKNFCHEKIFCYQEILFFLSKIFVIKNFCYQNNFSDKKNFL